MSKESVVVNCLRTMLEGAKVGNTEVTEVTNLSSSDFLTFDKGLTVSLRDGLEFIITVKEV